MSQLSQLTLVNQNFLISLESRCLEKWLNSVLSLLSHPVFSELGQGVPGSLGSPFMVDVVEVEGDIESKASHHLLGTLPQEVPARLPRLQSLRHGVLQALLGSGMPFDMPGLSFRPLTPNGPLLCHCPSPPWMLCGCGRKKAQIPKLTCRVGLA